MNGDDDGANAQTDESTSFGLSNCSKFAGFPIAAKKGNVFLILYALKRVLISSILTKAESRN